MNINLFDYQLPQELIAQYPVQKRDSSRMMVLNRSTHEIFHKNFRDLPEFLQSGDLLVRNSTKVIKARLLGRKEPSGGAVEVLLVRPAGGNSWECMVQPGRRLPEGSKVRFRDDFSCELTGRTEYGGRIARFDCDGDFLRIIDETGHVPLPPYIRRRDEKGLDDERYQTIYAKEPGSVAAPTAGLHFTGEIISDLEKKGVNIAEILLHVGPGTFLPVKTDIVENHAMHREAYIVPGETAESANRVREQGSRIVAVGTTTVRALETSCGNDHIMPGEGDTNLFIYPGYVFRAVDAMLTNFHLPRSTLLMMVSAFAVRDFILHAYKEAVREKYRFYSYGDCMLIL